MDNKFYGWMVLIIALLWLLPLIGVDQIAGTISNWIATLVLIVIGVKLLMSK